MIGGSNNTKGRPRIACEIGADRVIAARVSSRQSAIDLYSTRRLPTGSLAPGLSSENVLQRESLRDAIRGALVTLEGSGRDVIAILPDAAVRVLLIEFDDLPQKPSDAASVIRFRVKKSLPFDADTASLSFDVARSKGSVKVVAALAPQNVIQEYESAFLDSGYSPGIVMPSSIATLGVVEANRPTMIVKVDGPSTTVAIVNQQELILLRTLEHPGRTTVTAEDLTANVLPSMVFFEDTFSARIEQIFVTGMSAVQGLAAGLQAGLQDETGIRVEELSLNGRVMGEGLGDTVPSSMLAGVTGALLG
jgi:type IV pilus assembly protein PilM